MPYIKNAGQVCSDKDCNEPAKFKLMCKKHYMIIYRAATVERRANSHREWVAANKEKRAKSKRAYYDAHSEEISAKRKEYYSVNAEAERAKAVAKYRANREVMQARVRDYQKRNPWATKANARKRRALKHSAPTEFYNSTIIIKIYGSDCHLCGQPIDLKAPRRAGIKGWEKGLHMDHLIPLSRGGTDLIENIRPAHGYCNLSKHNRISS